MGAWNIAPADFWRMSLAEWWWLYDAKTQKPQSHNWEQDREMLDELGIDSLTRASKSEAQKKATKWLILLGAS